MNEEEDEDVDQELLDRHLTCLTEHQPYWEYVKTREGHLNKLYVCRKCNPKDKVKEGEDLFPQGNRE